MTTYTDHTQANPNAAEIEALQQERDRRTSPVLAGALAVALVALGVWWFTQRDASPAIDGNPAASVTAPQPAVIATDATPAARTPATTTRGNRPVAAIADRAPRPLAGNPLPEYPRAALRSGEEGSVLLNITVDARGVPTEVHVVEREGSRDRSFDRAAIEAARQWRFDPAMRDGRAVQSSVQLPVEFRRG